MPNDVREFEEEPESQAVRPSAPTHGTPQFVPQYLSLSDDDNKDSKDAVVNIENLSEPYLVGQDRTVELFLPQVTDLFDGSEFN